MIRTAWAFAQRCHPGPGTSAALAVLAAMATAPAAAAADTDAKAGIWTLSLDNTSRSCRINLRTDTVGLGLGLSMPPGCRRALPALRNVQAWTVPDDGRISLDDETGTPVVVFETGRAPAMQATTGDGQGLTLVPLQKPAPAPGEDTIVTLNTVQPDIPAVAANPATTPVTAKPKSLAVRDVAGRYAVMRGDRDTGCMVTLDPAARGPKNTLKAHLAPACRDQGIMVFDPLGWQLETGGMVLTARKGHSIRLDQGTDGTWVKQPADAKALGLKPI